MLLKQRRGTVFPTRFYRYCSETRVCMQYGRLYSMQPTYVIL